MLIPEHNRLLLSFLQFLVQDAVSLGLPGLLPLTPLLSHLQILLSLMSTLSLSCALKQSFTGVLVGFGMEGENRKIKCMK